MPCSVSLSYDGARKEHLTDVVPILREHGWRATFFVDTVAAIKDPTAWRELAQEGHELAAHPLYGCSEDGSMPNWTREMVAEEVRSAIRFGNEILGVPARGAALNGTDLRCADGDYRPVVEKGFDYVRTDQGGTNPAIFDPSQLKSIRLTTWNERGFARLLDQAHTWLILVFDDLTLGSPPRKLHDFTLEFLAVEPHGARILPVGDVLRTGVRP